MKKALITGIAGFAGSFLAQHLLQSSDYQITGVHISEVGLENLAHIRQKLTLAKINLLDFTAVSKLISETKPDEVYHLAALTSPSESFTNPSEVVTNNITAQLNILEALKASKQFSARVLVISSADVYGLVDEKDLPIDEQTPLRPTNPYAVSKIAQDFFGLQYFLSYGMPIVRVRPFNHIGPRQSPRFVIASIAKQIVDIEKSKVEPVIKIGNTQAKRDFTDVRDIVCAYQLALEKGAPGDVYNIGSGASHTISAVLQSLLSFSRVKITIEADRERLRPSDNPSLVCDSTKFEALTGWKAHIPLEQTLKDTLDYWRSLP
ncbi:MAG TPA: GDP-mannose 4,6-dehydratase [Candidatus Saccharimonadales bacterium]|nr:GDP-mannose 4,6-dehydratase [Candidatus Saccharimonadales bacterium]